jgi:WD40 repeat protein
MRVERAALVLCVLVGCRHSAGPFPPAVEAGLAASVSSYLTGPVLGLEEHAVLERRDFVYALSLSPSGSQVAFTRLRGREEVALVFDAFNGGVEHRWEMPVNSYVHDVEGVAFSPDGTVVVTASRDGVGRFFWAQDGTARGRFAGQEPLTDVAFHPNGRFVLFGSARGALMAVHYPSLAFAGEVQAHTGELHGLAVAQDGRIFTGGWDGTVAAWATEEREVSPEGVLVPVTRHGPLTLVRAELNGAPASLSVDRRAAYLFVTEALAQTAGLDPARLTETVLVEEPLGTRGVKRARHTRLVLKGLALEGVDVAVCDVCVPRGADGVLGGPLFEQAEVSWRGDSLLLTPREPHRSATLGFTLQYRAELGRFVNDVTVDRAGGLLGVAVSPDRPERTKAIYDREKRGDFGQEGPLSAALVVEASTGRPRERHVGHHGVVSTSAISPDGGTLVSGGWDKTFRLFQVGRSDALEEHTLGWSIRRIRFSPDARWLGVAAWTPARVGDSDPSAVVYGVRYGAPLRVAR